MTDDIADLRRVVQMVGNRIRELEALRDLMAASLGKQDDRIRELEAERDEAAEVIRRFCAKNGGGTKAMVEFLARIEAGKEPA